MFLECRMVHYHFLLDWRLSAQYLQQQQTDEVFKLEVRPANPLLVVIAGMIYNIYSTSFYNLLTAARQRQWVSGRNSTVSLKRWSESIHSFTMYSLKPFVMLRNYFHKSGLKMSKFKRLKLAKTVLYHCSLLPSNTSEFHT